MLGVFPLCTTVLAGLVYEVVLNSNHSYGHVYTSPSLSAKITAQPDSVIHAHTSSLVFLTPDAYIGSLAHEHNFSSPLVVMHSALVVANQDYGYTFTQPSMSASAVALIDSVVHDHTWSIPIIVPSLANPSGSYLTPVDKSFYWLRYRVQDVFTPTPRATEPVAFLEVA